MKPMLLAFFATAVIAVGANFVLGALNFSTGGRTASETVRKG